MKELRAAISDEAALRKLQGRARREDLERHIGGSVFHLASKERPRAAPPASGRKVFTRVKHQVGRGAARVSRYRQLLLP